MIEPQFAIVAICAFLLLAVGVLSLCLCEANSKLQDQRTECRALRHKAAVLSAVIQQLSTNLLRGNPTTALDHFLAEAERHGLLPGDEREAA